MKTTLASNESYISYTGLITVHMCMQHNKLCCSREISLQNFHSCFSTIYPFQSNPFKIPREHSPWHLNQLELPPHSDPP